MKQHIVRWGVGALLFVASLSGTASAQLEWRVSVKFILDVGGNRPPSGNVNTDAEVQEQIDAANEILLDTGRGYTLRLTEIVDVSGQAAWFNSCDVSAIDAAAKSAPFAWSWRTNAINVYVTGNSCAGVCSFPGGGQDAVVLGQGAWDTTLGHEIGHFMDLCHTQGCPCGSCAGGVGQCNTIPASDGIADTLPDLACWNVDDISDWSFDLPYSELAPWQRNLVDDVFMNLMSYHDPNNRSRLTEDQMDHATDVSNVARLDVASGITHFVDDDAISGIANGSSVAPWADLDSGLSAAAATGAALDDVVLLRAGTYEVSSVIDQPVTILASRGPVLLTK